LILKKGRNGETYCVGGDNQPTNLEIVKLLCQILDQKLPRPDGKSHVDQIQYVTDRPGHDFRYDIDITKIERELGWQPSFELKAGLEETVDWYLNHPSWVDSVLEKSEFSHWINANYQKRT
jgi:dTDP-glucose 4,6-dehydratase